MAEEKPHETAELAPSGSSSPFPSSPLATLGPLFPTCDPLSDHRPLPTDTTYGVSREQQQNYQVPSRPSRSSEAKYRTARVVSPLQRLPRDPVCSDEALEEEENSGAEKGTSTGASNVAVKTNFCTVRVPPNTVYLVERSGCFHRILDSGTRLLIPRIDRVAYVFSQKVQKLSFSTTNVYTSDRVEVTVSGTLFYRVTDPVTAAYSIMNMRDAMVDVAVAAIHHRYAQITIRLLFADLNAMWEKLAGELNATFSIWGCVCLRCFTANELPSNLTAAYERLVHVRLQREIDEVSHKTDGKNTEADISKIKATAAADETSEIEGIVMKGKANAKALKEIAVVLGEPNGKEAAKVWIASKYIDSMNRSTSIDASGPAQIGDEALNEALKHTFSTVIPPAPVSSSSVVSAGKRGKPRTSTAPSKSGRRRPFFDPDAADEYQLRSARARGSSSEGTDSNEGREKELRSFGFFEERSGVAPDSSEAIYGATNSGCGDPSVSLYCASKDGGSALEATLAKIRSDSSDPSALDIGSPRPKSPFSNMTEDSFELGRRRRGTATRRCDGEEGKLLK